MGNMALSRPLANKPHLPSAYELSDLADADLSEIFKRLPLYDRLLVSLVCKRWLCLSRMAWLDVTHLDLSPIPSPNIAVIVGQCPNLQTVYAKGKTFDVKQLHSLSCIPLQSVTLCECSSVIMVEPRHSCVEDAFSVVFSSNLQNASWTELSLRDFAIIVRDRLAVAVKVGIPASSLPASLKRLQLNNLTIKQENRPFIPFPVNTFNGLNRLQQLECLILSNARSDLAKNPIEKALDGLGIFYNIETLSNLRELYLGACVAFVPILQPLLHLPKLEVLFLHNIVLGHTSSPSSEFAWLNKLASEHPRLRILILKGRSQVEIELAPRRRYPNGLGSSPAPLLHIFLDKELSEMIRFPTAFDSAVIYTFNEPLAQFLEKDEIQPIFKGVWIAEKIKEAATIDA